MKRVLRRIAIGAIVVLGFGAAGLVCERVGERGRYVSAYSTYGSGPDGTRGVFLLADRMGAHPQRWAEELGRLPEGGMLVALGSCDQLMRRDMGRLEREELKRWIERGGTLVVAGVPEYVTMEAFGVELVRDPEICGQEGGILGMIRRAQRGEEHSGEEHGGDEQEEEPEQDLPGAFREDPAGTYDEVTEVEGPPPPRLTYGAAPPLNGVVPIGMRRAIGVRVDDEAPSTTLLMLGEDAPAGVRVPIGRGSVIALASASMFTNADLRTQGGGVLFARLVREVAPHGPVLFDEYHLGVGQRRSMMRYLRQIGGTGVVLQILLLVVFFIWRAGARFGATRSDPPPEPAGTASYVEGVATLYAKARDPSGAARIVIRRAYARIAAHHHLGSADPPRMAELLDERRRRPAADAVRGLIARQEQKHPNLARLVEEIDALVAQACAA